MTRSPCCPAPAEPIVASACDCADRRGPRGGSAPVTEHPEPARTTARAPSVEPAPARRAAFLRWLRGFAESQAVGLSWRLFGAVVKTWLLPFSIPLE